MGYASIDIDELQAVVDALKDDVLHLDHDASVIVNKLGWFDLPTYPASRMRNVAAWADHAVVELQARVDRANKVAKSLPSFPTIVAIEDDDYTSDEIPTDPSQVMPDPPGPSAWSKFWRFLGNMGADAGNVAVSFGNACMEHPEDLISTLSGVLLIIAGSGGEAGGAALDATGIGAVIGVPLNIASAAVITAGVGLAGVGVSQIAVNAMNNPQKPFQGPQAPSRWPTKVTGYANHALFDSMPDDRLGRWVVEDIVDNPDRPPEWQPTHGTWLFMRGKTCVAVAPDGVVVTVFVIK